MEAVFSTIFFRGFINSPSEIGLAEKRVIGRVDTLENRHNVYSD
jgi:hypothetical protein